MLVRKSVKRPWPNIRKLSYILVTIKLTEDVDSNTCRSMY